jgi:hypothetical protein
VARLLAYISGLVNQELLPHVEYLAAENRILRAHVPGRLRLSNAERSTLEEIGNRLGRKSLSKVAQVAKPETILDWWRKLVAKKFDGSKHRSYPGRPRISPEVESLRVRLACENPVSPAPKRSRTTTWKQFIASHLEDLVADLARGCSASSSVSHSGSRYIVGSSLRSSSVKCTLVDPLGGANQGMVAPA